MTAFARQFLRFDSLCREPSRLPTKLARLLSTSGEAENPRPLARNYSTSNPRPVYSGAAHTQNTRHGRGSVGSFVLHPRLSAKLGVDFARFCPILPDRSQPTVGGCREVAVHFCTIDKRR